MSAAVLGVGAVHPSDNQALTLAAQILCGAATYAAALWLAHPAAAEGLLRVVRKPSAPVIAEAPVLRTDPI